MVFKFEQPELSTVTPSQAPPSGSCSDSDSAPARGLRVRIRPSLSQKYAVQRRAAAMYPPPPPAANLCKSHFKSVESVTVA